MLLRDKLDGLKVERLAKTPPKVSLVRQRAVKGFAASGLAKRAMHAAGEQAPSFQPRDTTARRSPRARRCVAARSCSCSTGEMVPILQHRPPRD